MIRNGFEQKSNDEKEDESHRSGGRGADRSGRSLLPVRGPDTTGTYRAKTRRLAHFELLEQLGIGHFGSVWKARDTQLDRTVAIKIPRKEQLDEQDRDLFFRDARAAAQLRHPNIVSVHEVGRDGDTIYIAMDYIEGATLTDWLKGQPLAPREAAELMVKIARSVHHAHENGVIHRDLKPDNIMMGLDQEPHIMDFGLAKRESGEITMTVDGTTLGTPAYMPPEQARGKAHDADARSDVYSLGVILYEMLSGTRPFHGTKRMLIMQILEDDPPSLRILNNKIPRDLETICLKCLEKDSARRYASAGALAADLRRVLHNEPILARPVGRIERVWRWCRRNPAVASLSTAICLVLAVGTFISTYLAIEATKRASAERLARGDEWVARRQAEIARNDALAAATAERTAHLTSAKTAFNLQLRRAWDLRKTDPQVARELLMDETTCPLEMRDISWRMLSEMATRRRTDLIGHTSRVSCVAFTQDGATLASGDDAGNLKLWDARTGKALAALPSVGWPVRQIAFSNDSQLMAIGGDEILLWSRKENRVLWSAKPLDSAACYLKFAQKDGLLVAADRRHVKIVDCETGEPTAIPYGGPEAVRCITSDDSRIAFATLKTLYIWNMLTLSEQWRVEHAFLPQQLRLSGELSVYDNIGISYLKLEDGRLRTIKPASTAGSIVVVRACQFDPGGDSVAEISGGGGAMNPDGPYKTLRFTDFAKGEVYLVAKEPFGGLERHNPPLSVSDTTIATSIDKTVVLWSLPTLSVQRFSGMAGMRALNKASFSPRESKMFVVSDDGFVRVMDTHTWTVAGETRIGKRQLDYIDISPDGQLVAVGGYFDNAVIVLNATSLMYEFTLHMNKNVRGLKFADGRRLLIALGGSEVVDGEVVDGEIVDMDVERNQIEKRIAIGKGVVNFAEHAHRAVVAAKDVVRVYDCRDGACLFTHRFPKVETKVGVSLIAGISSDGKRVAVSHSREGWWLFNLHSDKPPVTIKDPEFRDVMSINFAPDGQSVFVGTWDNRLHVVDSETGQERFASEYDEPFWSVAVSHQEDWIVGCAGKKYPWTSGSMVIWKTATSTSSRSK